MSAIAIAYTSSSGTSYNVTFNSFSGPEIARTYDASADFQRGSSGTQLISGRGGRQKYIWAISGHLDKETAKNIDDMFQAWDADRSLGLAAAVGIVDQTGVSNVTAQAVFTTPPSYTKFGPSRFAVALGLTEV